MNDLFCKTAITVLGLLPFPIVCFFYFSLPAQVSTQLGSSVTTTNKDSLLYGLVLPLLLLVVYWLIRAKERGNAKSLQYLNLNFSRCDNFCWCIDPANLAERIFRV